MFRRVLVEVFFLSASQSVCAITLRSWIVLLHFDFKYLMRGLNVNFLSKIIPWNLCSSTMGISVETSTGLFWQRLQKCIHCVLLWENLKSFLMVQLFISYLDIVGVDILLFQCVLICIYSEPSTPKLKQFTMLFIFILNKVTVILTRYFFNHSILFWSLC